MSDISEMPIDAKKISDSQKDQKLFILIMLSVTLFCIFFFPAFFHIRNDFKIVNNVFDLLLILSTMHVALTLYFYLDPTYKKHTLQHSKFYIFLPVLVIIMCGLIGYGLGEAGVIYLFLFYHAWLLYHYGRQNFGLLSFINIIEKGPQLDRDARLALELAPLAGIFAAHTLLGQFNKSIFADFKIYSYWLGVALQLAALAFATRSILNSQKTFSWRNIFLFVTTCFYIPTFLFASYSSAILGYAVAHALQYFFFMYFLSAGVPQKQKHQSFFALLFSAIIGVTILWTLREKVLWGDSYHIISAISLGVVMWHFIMDAGVWRLRKEWQRAEVMKRFGFIFAK